MPVTESEMSPFDSNRVAPIRCGCTIRYTSALPFGDYRHDNDVKNRTYDRLKLVPRQGRPICPDVPSVLLRVGGCLNVQ